MSSLHVFARANSQKGLTTLNNVVLHKHTEHVRIETDSNCIVEAVEACYAVGTRTCLLASRKTIF